MEKRVLVLINSSYGEIQWILPVLKYIRDNYKGIRILTLFNSINKEELLKESSFYNDLLSTCTDQVYDFGDFLPFKKYLKTIFFLADNKIKGKPSVIEKSWSKIKTFTKLIFVKKIVKKINPSLLLKDVEPDDGFRKIIVQTVQNSGSKSIMYPHAAELYSEGKNKLRPELFADAILCNTQDMKEIFLEKKKCHITGIPRFDSWWIDFLKNRWKEHYEKLKIPDNHKIFLLFTPSPAPTLFSQETRFKLINDVIGVILSFKNSFLIIKPHPRDNLVKIKEIINNYDKRIIIDNSSPISLSNISDVIISIGHSSVVLDSLAVDKIVFGYIKKMKRIDTYGKMGFIPTTRNLRLLKRLIENTSSLSNQKNRYINEFRKIIPRAYNESTKKATNVILNMLQK